jgi:hypothetical protein
MHTGGRVDLSAGKEMPPAERQELLAVLRNPQAQRALCEMGFQEVAPPADYAAWPRAEREDFDRSMKQFGTRVAEHQLAQLLLQQGVTGDIRIAKQVAGELLPSEQGVLDISTSSSPQTLQALSDPQVVKMIVALVGARGLQALPLSTVSLPSSFEKLPAAAREAIASALQTHCPDLRAVHDHSQGTLDVSVWSEFLRRHLPLTTTAAQIQGKPPHVEIQGQAYDAREGKHGSLTLQLPFHSVQAAPARAVSGYRKGVERSLSEQGIDPGSIRLICEYTCCDPAKAEQVLHDRAELAKLREKPSGTYWRDKAVFLDRVEQMLDRIDAGEDVDKAVTDLIKENPGQMFRKNSAYMDLTYRAWERFSPDDRLGNLFVPYVLSHFQSIRSYSGIVEGHFGLHSYIAAVRNVLGKFDEDQLAPGTLLPPTSPEFFGVGTIIAFQSDSGPAALYIKSVSGDECTFTSTAALAEESSEVAFNFDYDASLQGVKEFWAEQWSAEQGIREGKS